MPIYLRMNVFSYVAAFAALFLIAFSAIAYGDEPSKTPLTDGKIHLGVPSCYGSTCHSRQEATGTVVRQNEILTWQDETATTGAHLRAYKILFEKRSVEISKRLGLGPAHQAQECLSCHSDNIAPALRGKKFQVNDGIGCESCHGGSTDWLASHYAEGATHQSSLKRGLYPLEDSRARAKLCLSCHIGSEADGQFVNHRLMAAGHPRMSFELDLFTALQKHHDEDIDYFQRKTVQTGAQVWAIGQAETLKSQLRLFSNPALSQDGVFPEPVFFDCRACHRPISDDRDWYPRAAINPGRPSAPGQIRFNDANMIMLLAIARHIDVPLADRYDREIKAFHAALSGAGSKESAIAALQGSTDQLMAIIDQTEFSRPQTLDILDMVLVDAITRRYTDYVGGEQAIMAVDTLLSSLVASEQASRSEILPLRATIETGYDAVENPDDYKQGALTGTLKTLRSELETLR